MLLHLAPNSTFFTSLPLTIGRTYGLLTLTIRLGILSFALPLLWWLRCWRYIFVIVSVSESCLSEKSPAQGFSLSSLLSSASIFHGQVQKAADYLASPLLGVTALLHIGHVVTGRHQDILSSYDGCPVHGLPRTSSDIPFLYIPTTAWHRSDSAWHSRNRWHRYRAYRDSSCKASMLLPVPPADSVFSDGWTVQGCYQVLGILRHVMSN